MEPLRNAAYTNDAPGANEASLSHCFRVAPPTRDCCHRRSTPDGQPFSYELRDASGGNIQAIKPPTLLEICGPLFMSYPAISNVQYRLTEENGITRLKFTHRAMGQIPHDAQIERGGHSLLARIRSAAQLSSHSLST